MADTFSDARLEIILTSVGEHLVVVPAPFDDRDARRQLPRGRAGSLSPRRCSSSRSSPRLWSRPRGRPSRGGSGSAAPASNGFPTGRAIRVGCRRSAARSLPRLWRRRRRALGGAFRSSRPSGRADAVYVPPEGGVILSWPEGSTTLWIRDPDFEPAMFVKKLVDAGEPAESIQGVGDEALIVEGIPHPRDPAPAAGREHRAALGRRRQGVSLGVGPRPRLDG